MKLVATGMVAAFSLAAAPALAAPPAFTWTGFYFGVNGGYGGAPFGAHDVQIDSSVFPFFGRFTRSDSASRAGGFLFGGQIGYNYRFDNRVVLGVESDMQWSDIRRSSQVESIEAAGGRFGSVGSSRAALDWFGTSRLRLGYAIGRLLPYVTAGVAYGGLSAGLDGAEASALVGATSATTNATGATRLGWAAGAGAEYALTGNLSLKTEYLYAAFGGLSGPLATAYPALPAPPRPASWGGGSYWVDRAGIHIFRAGLNYRFVGGGSGFEAPSFIVPGVDPHNWSGFYVGVNGGYGGGVVGMREEILRTLFAPSVVTATSTRADGLIAGGQAGYNWQFPNGFVLGVETDAQWSGIRWSGARALHAFSPAPVFVTADPDNGPRGAVTWFGTTRLRLGYAFDRVMPFVTGGVAYGEVSARSRIAGVTNAGGVGFFDSWIASGTGVKAGWTAGGGLEYAITGALSLKTEYDYVELGGLSARGSGLYTYGTGVTPGGQLVALNAPSAGSFTTGPVGVHMIRAGLNWRLDALPF